MASLTHPSATNYHLQSLPRSKMNPLSNTNYSRSLAAIALANHSAALNQLSALNSSASASSSTTDFSGPPPLGDARMSALLLREPNDVSVTSSPLGSPNAPPWPHHHFNVGAAAALAGSHAHHNNSYFSPPSDHHLGQGFQGAAATNIETALKKLGECSRIAATDTCLRDFNGMSHQQLSLSSVQPLHHLRSSTEATNIGRFGGVSTMGSTSQQQQQQQQQLLRDNLAATPSSRNDWSAIQQCTDPNLSFASSMAALGIPSAADSMRGSLSARAILLGGRGSNRAQQQPESYMLAGNAAEVLNDGGCLSSRMLASLGNGSQQDNSCLLAAARNGDVGGLADDAILQEMIGSYNAGNAVASSVMNAHLHSLPSSPNSQHFLNSGGAMQAGIEATLNGATDWAALLMDTGAGSPHPGMDSGLSKGNLSAPAMAAGPRGGLSSLFTSESGFAERTAKMLFHAAAEGQIQGDILGQPNNSLHLTATFLDGASSMNFAASGGIESTHAGASHLQPDIPAAAAGSSGSPLQSPGFGGKRATLLTSNSTRNRLEDSVRDKHQLGTSPGRLAGTDNLSDPGRMWRPSNNGCAAKETGKQSHQTGGAGAGGGLTRTLSGNSRGSAGMLDSLSGRAAKDALELEMEQCSSMSAMLDDLPLPERRFTKSGRKLSRTSSPSVSTMMDLAAMEPGTGNSSACNSASERGDTPADDKKSDVPVREEPSRSLLLVKGKPALSANQDIGEAGGENSSSTKQEVKENSGDSQGKKRKDRAPEEKLSGGKTSTTSSRTIPVKENNKIEEADAANRSKRSRGSTSDPDPVRGRPGDTRSRSGSDNSSDSAAGASAAKDHAKPPEAPKPDYIHVRARRGQATDSHSLAERVRREKISERMKYLQDLVPGCSKVTGKAMMLDEIINYVQSLQRQVEFLSMKLQSLNPRTDFSMESLLSTEHSRGFTQGGQQQLMIGSESITIPSSAYPQLHPQQQAIAMQQLAVTCGLDMRSLGTQLDTVAGGLRRSLVSPAAGSSITMAQSARDPFEETVSPVSTVWDGELHSVVQMGYAQNRLSSLASSSLRGSLPPGNMKLER